MINLPIKNLRSCILVAFVVITLVGPTYAEPTIAVTNLGANADGNLEWRVDVSPDVALFSDDQGSLAAEIGFEFAGSTLLDTDVNVSDWSFENPGFNPFTSTVTMGLDVSNTEAFVAFGSDPVAETIELVTFTTSGTGPTTLSWGGYEIRPGLPGGFIGGRVSQAGQNFDGFSGSLSQGGMSSGPDCSFPDSLPALLGDLNESDSVDFADFLVLSANFGQDGNYTDGDIDCDGTVAFGDFLILSANFGQTSGALATVPEPESLPLLCFAVLSALVWRSTTNPVQRRLRSQ